MAPPTFTREYLQHLLHYDPLTGVWTWVNPRSTKIRSGDVAGTIQAKGYRYIKIDGRSYITARLAFFYIEGLWPEDEVDHVNRVSSDDRWENLRPADRTLNNLNRVKLGASRVPGVRKHNSNDRYVASYGKVYIGSYKTIEEAIAGRKEFMERNELELTVSDLERNAS